MLYIDLSKLIEVISVLSSNYFVETVNNRSATYGCDVDCELRATLSNAYKRRCLIALF